MRKTFFFLFSSLSLFSFSIYAQNTIKLDRKISVVGSGTVTAFPDAAQITISFLHIKPTLREAINENQLTSEQVLKIVKKYVSDSTEIQTSLISTDKSYKWDQKLSKEVFVGFQSSQKLIFTLKNLNKFQDFTEELLKTKFNKIERIFYFNTNSKNLLIQAQELAVQDAIETSERLAANSKVTLGKIMTIETKNSSNETVETNSNNNFQSFSKGMGGRGVSSSGDLINYTIKVFVETELLN